MKKFEIVSLVVLLLVLSIIVSARVNACSLNQEVIDEVQETKTVEPIVEQTVEPTDLTNEQEIEETSEETSEIKVVYEISYDVRDVQALAQMVWGEARGCTEEDKRNCCITACNRADDSRFPNSVYECITQPFQYLGYSADNPIDEELYAIAENVLIHWSLKKQGVDVEWNDYNSFWGDGIRNHFYIY